MQPAADGEARRRRPRRRARARPVRGRLRRREPAGSIDRPPEPRSRPPTARRRRAARPRPPACVDEPRPRPSRGARARGRVAAEPRRPSPARSRRSLAPPFVGLTGGIGAGKSEALAALARLGAATLSTDAVVHELYADPEVRDAVVARWGPDVAPGGVVDRAAVARRAFAAPEERAWLEGLLWPRVGARVAAWRAHRGRPHAAAARARRRDAAAVRGGPGGGLRRYARGRRRRGGARTSARRRAGTPRSTSAPPASSARRRRRRGPTTSSATTGISPRWSRNSPGYLRSCRTEHEHAHRHPHRRRRARRPSAPARRRRGAPAPARAARGRRARRPGRGARASRRGPTRRCRRSRCPLRHEDIIRQQAREKDLDPALIAGVIYAESHFRDQTSAAGAKGLMQLMPGHRRLHRGPVGRHGVRAGRPGHAPGQHRLRLLVPALPAEQVRRQRDPRARRVQRRRRRRSTSGAAAPRRAARRSGRRTTSRSRRRAATSSACSRRASSTGASTRASWRSSPAPRSRSRSSLRPIA